MAHNLGPAVIPGNSSTGPGRRRGRPPIPLTDEVLERRRLSRQRLNAARPKRAGTSKGRGRPRRGVSEDIPTPNNISSPAALQYSLQGGNTESSVAVPASCPDATTTSAHGDHSAGASASARTAHPPVAIANALTGAFNSFEASCPHLLAGTSEGNTSSGTSISVQASPPCLPPGTSEENETGEACAVVAVSNISQTTSFLQGISTTGPGRRRGRPPIRLTDEVLVRRRLSRQTLNAARPKRDHSAGASASARNAHPPVTIANALTGAFNSFEESCPHLLPRTSQGNPSSGTSDSVQASGPCLPPGRSEVSFGDPPARKPGRPPIAITPEVLERRRLSRKRNNDSRPKVEGPSRRRGRPPRPISEANQNPRTSSSVLLQHHDQNDGMHTSAVQTSALNLPAGSTEGNVSAPNSSILVSSNNPHTTSSVPGYQKPTSNGFI